MPWAAAAAVVGAGISANASSKASKAQANSAREANALQKEQFDKQIELQEPFRQAGLSAQNRLLYLLGLGGNSTGTPSAPAAPDRNALRNQFLGQFTRTSSGPSQAELAAEIAQYGMPRAQMLANSGWTPDGQFTSDGVEQNSGRLPVAGSAIPSTHIDEAGLNAEIERQMAASQALQGSQGNPNDPAFGSLMRDFSMADYQADPGYQFRQSEGEKAYQRAASSAGRSDSGRAYKDLMRFNSGLASQEYGNAFDRFQTNRSNKLNPLQSLMGAAQTSSNALGQAAQNYGVNAGANIIGAGNARAASGIASGNALAGGVNGAVSAWNRYNQPQQQSWGGTSLQNFFSGTGGSGD